MENDIEKKIKTLKRCKIGLLIGIVVGVLGTVLESSILLLSIICTILYFPVNKKLKKLLRIKEVSKSKPVSELEKHLEEVSAKYIFFKFTVAGVTYKDGDISRQTTLRALKYGDENIESIDLENYEYEGQPAVYVKINDNIVGNIPANKVSEFLELEKIHHRDNIVADVYGGKKLPDGGRGNYGCEVTVRYVREKI